MSDIFARAGKHGSVAHLVCASSAFCISFFYWTPRLTDQNTSCMCRKAWHSLWTRCLKMRVSVCDLQGLSVCTWWSFVSWSRDMGGGGGRGPKKSAWSRDLFYGSSLTISVQLFGVAVVVVAVVTCKIFFCVCVLLVLCGLAPPSPHSPPAIQSSWFWEGKFSKKTWLL
jgi:hypothetical protein